MKRAKPRGGYGTLQLQYTCDFDRVDRLCRDAFSRGGSNYKNMDWSDWQSKPWTLLNKWANGVFDPPHGCLYGVYSDHEGLAGVSTLVGVSGVYRSEFDAHTFIGGVRTWISPAHRLYMLVGDYLLPRQIEFAKQHGGRAFVMTFNEESKRIALLLDAVNRQLDSSAEQVKFFGKRTPEAYVGMRLYPHKVRIQNTDQYVVIRSLDGQYVPNLTSIHSAR